MVKHTEALAYFQECINPGTTKVQVTSLCRLWAGMGHIYRVSSSSASSSANKQDDKLIVKHVTPPSQKSFGDVRKTKSYLVEAQFYQHVAKDVLAAGIGVPTPFKVIVNKDDDEVTICMSELQGRPFSSRSHTHAVLTWLANFHALYWGHEAVDKVVSSFGLHEVGSYWHLDTRPDEHADMSAKGLSGRLKRAARAIDERLKSDQAMQCLVHGDVKDANILLPDQGQAFLYDFQYVGKSPPTRDLAYFFASSVDESLDPDELLAFYLEALSKRLSNPPSFQALKDSLDLAYCDYYRFMCGWGFWGDSDLESRVKAVMDRLDGGQMLQESEYYDAIRREYGW